MNRGSQTAISQPSQYFVMTLPAIILFAIFVVYPVFGGVYFSLTNWDGINSVYSFIGLENYKTLFHDPFVLVPLRNTVVFAVLLTFLQNIISLGLALALNHQLKTKNLLRVLLFVPVVLSPLVVGYIWSFLFSEPIAQLGKQLGLEIVANNLLGHPKTALYSGVFVGAWRMCGWTMVIYVAALQGIPPEMYDACHVDGATGWKRFWHVILPLIAPALTVNLVMTMQRGFKEFDLLFALTKGGPGNASELISLTIYNESFQYFRAAYGSTMGVILFGIIAIVSLVQLKYLRRNEDRIS